MARVQQHKKLQAIAARRDRNAWGRERWLHISTALLVLLFALFTIMTSANAQSVRPPAGAVNQPNDTQGPPNALGNQSDTDLWRSVRRSVPGNVSIGDKQSGVLVQSDGEYWRALRNGPLPLFGIYAMGGILVALVLFYLLRGRIRIEHGESGFTVTRFGTIDRAAHWMLAVSFILLALTGLNVTYGKTVLMPLLGKEAFATISAGGKWIHNNVAWAFMASLAMIFLLWVKDNIPAPRDVTWLLKGGGLFSEGSHVPAKRFNAGQKLIFWMVVLGGLSLSMSGWSLLFPFETQMFGKTFAVLNKIGFDLPTTVTALQEQQYATMWHAVVSMFMIAVIIAHIYIGSIGMEGAFAAMGSGQVDTNWAKEHHSIWYEEVKDEGTASGAAPVAAE